MTTTDRPASDVQELSVEEALHRAKWSKVHDRALPTAHAHDALFTLAAEIERLREAMRELLDSAREVDALYVAGEMDDCGTRVDSALSWLHMRIMDYDARED